MRSTAATAAVLFSAAALSAASLVAAHSSGKHAHPARLEKSDPTKEGVEFSLDKRQASNARFTYYDTSVGLGACGKYHGNEEYTVALNSAQLNAAGGYSSYPPSVCGRSISIQWGGKTISATIQDECPTCPYGGLDLSAGLFSAFASHDVGVIYGTWWYNDGSNQPTTTKEEPKWTPPATTSTTPAWTPPTTSSTPEWTPTTTWTPPAPTTTSTSSTPEWTPEPTTSSVAPTTSSSAAPSSSAPGSSSSASFGGSSALPSGAASASASGSAARSGAAFTLSAAASASASASGSAGSGTGIKGGQVINDNLEMLGSLVDMMGKTVCNGNLMCAP